MIEVEKKFILNEQDKKRLTKNAQFLNERIFTDIYYDTEIFSLTSKDKWFRSREGRFELKLPLHDGVDRLADQYDELEDEQKIREALNLPSNGNLADDLIKAGYSPFCTCKTNRRKYKKEPFIINLDIIDFQDFTYNIGEIELMISNKSEIEDASKKIMYFAKTQNLVVTPVRGKIIEYLKRAKPNHYQTLVKRGVVEDF
ncbi:MAG: CYTH domain-containing protein [Candidatus Pacebacteria bacterium]|nr:CYTH domain-containing protein [Candidatus Paceibacterota bacterium]